MLSVKKKGFVSLVQRKNTAARRVVPGTQLVSQIRCVHTPTRCIQRVAPGSGQLESTGFFSPNLL